MKKIVGMALLLVMLWSYPVLADSVTFNSGTTNYATEITVFTTYGDMMDGMKVTAYFSGGGSESATWATTGSEAGGAFGTGWSLTQSDDTFGYSWTLNTGDNLITSLVIDAWPGKTVFDTRAEGDVDGTANSARGWDFERTSGDLVVDAFYWDLVALPGEDPFGDLFRSLELVFNGGQGFSGTMSYISDTDNITSPSGVVPEPATMLLLGSGLIGLAGFARRRFKK